MLGLRLERDLEERLDGFAAQTRRSRSQIAREALREYLDRHAIDAEWRRQIALIAASTTEEDLDRLDADHDDMTADEPDYNWGDKRP
ncbi:MAG: ribbon-helix-helix protein, CopG family [Sphingomonas fennica]